MTGYKSEIFLERCKKHLNDDYNNYKKLKTKKESLGNVMR